MLYEKCKKNNTRIINPYLPSKTRWNGRIKMLFRTKRLLPLVNAETSVHVMFGSKGPSAKEKEEFKKLFCEVEDSLQLLLKIEDYFNKVEYSTLFLQTKTTPVISLIRLAIRDLLSSVFDLQSKVEILRKGRKQEEEIADVLQDFINSLLDQYENYFLQHNESYFDYYLFFKLPNIWIRELRMESAMS